MKLQLCLPHWPANLTSIWRIPKPSPLGRPSLFAPKKLSGPKLHQEGDPSSLPTEAPLSRRARSPRLTRFGIYPGWLATRDFGIESSLWAILSCHFTANAAAERDRCSRDWDADQSSVEIAVRIEPEASASGVYVTLKDSGAPTLPARGQIRFDTRKSRQTHVCRSLLFRLDRLDLRLDLEIERELHDGFDDHGVDHAVKAVAAQTDEDAGRPLAGPLDRETQTVRRPRRDSVSAAVYEPTEFAMRIKHSTDEIHAAPTDEGVERVLLPGEREWAFRRKALVDGILLPEDVQETLKLAAEMAGIEPL